MKIEWSAKAERQVREIFDFHVSAAGEKAARKIVQKIYMRTTLLPNNPRGGGREELLEDRPKGYRRLVVGNYKIVYYVKGDAVRISAVFDCRRDPARLRDEVPK